MSTIAVDDDVKQDLEGLKVHENESFNDVVKRLLDDEPPEPFATVDVDGDSIRETIGEEIEKRLDAITVNVEMDELDLSGSEVTEEDVRTVVRSEIESTVHEKARQI